jgi:hypothetical protein
MKWKVQTGRPVTSIRTALTPKGVKPIRWVLPFIPLLFLAIDIALFPVLIETSDPAEGVTGLDLISGRYLVRYLGNFKAHRVYLSLDDIDDQDYLPFITKSLPEDEDPALRIWDSSRRSNTALVLSWGSVELTRILGKLASLSSDDHDGIINLIRSAPLSENILWYDFKSVSSTSPSSSALPLDQLIILKLQNQQKFTDLAQFREMLERASKQRLSTLVLPCLTSATPLNSNPSLACRATYGAFFQTLQVGTRPKIFLSLDKNWSTEKIQEAVKSIKESWTNNLKRDDKASGAMPTLYQSDIRLLLLFLPICLLVCSFRVELRSLRLRSSREAGTLAGRDCGANSRLGLQMRLIGYPLRRVFIFCRARHRKDFQGASWRFIPIARSILCLISLE